MGEGGAKEVAGWEYAAHPCLRAFPEIASRRGMIDPFPATDPPSWLAPVDQPAHGIVACVHQGSTLPCHAHLAAVRPCPRSHPPSPPAPFSAGALQSLGQLPAACWQRPLWPLRGSPPPAPRVPSVAQRRQQHQHPACRLYSCWGAARWPSLHLPGGLAAAELAGAPQGRRPGRRPS